MPARKSFALRIDAKTYDAMQRWAKDDLRSLNAQIEFVLRESLRRAGRLGKPQPDILLADDAETGEEGGD
jgi:hypothetical protein